MQIVSDTFQLVSPALHKAVTQKEAPIIIESISQLVISGSEALDLNLGPLGKAGPTVIPYLLDVIRSVTRLPLFIDSPNAEAARTALHTGHSGIHINGFSLQPQRIKAFLPLMARHEEALFVGYLLTETGAVPTHPDGRLHVAAELFET